MAWVVSATTVIFLMLSQIFLLLWLAYIYVCSTDVMLIITEALQWRARHAPCPADLALVAGLPKARKQAL